MKTKSKDDPPAMSKRDRMRTIKRHPQFIAAYEQKSRIISDPAFTLPIYLFLLEYARRI
jgi:hypothetical protein